MKFVALYPRVSTQEQAKEGYSIDEQIERLKSYCHVMGWKNFKLYIDAGFSGGNMNRPALQNMIKDIEAGKVEKVVVYKLDRLSRSQKDTLNMIEDIFLKNGVDFVSICENFDTASPFGRAMVGILAVFAQLEREQIKERLLMGREARAKEGRWIGVGNVPVGYNYENGQLIIEPFEALQVQELFELYIAGNSPRKIAKIFNEKGYKTRYGKWYEKRIVTTLQNPVYIGKVKFNSKLYNGLHCKIINVNTFNKAQEEIEARRRSVIPAARHSALLSGIIFCKHCGARYGITQSGKYKYYTCYSRRKRDAAMIKNPNCKNKNWKLEKLNQIIIEEIKKLYTDPNYIFEIKQNQKTDPADQIKTIQSQIEKLEAQRLRFLDLYGLGTFTAEELQAKVEPLTDQIDSLKAEVEKTETDQTKLNEEETLEIISKFADIIDGEKESELRPLVIALIEKIEIDGERLFIHWNF